MFRRAAAILVVVLVAFALLVAVWPQALGLESTIGIAQLIALRGAAACVAAVVAVALALIALLARPARRILLAGAIVAAVFCASTLAVLAGRGWNDTPLPDAKPTDVTVLSWNTLGAAPGAAAIADLALANSADIVSLPETTRGTGLLVARRMRLHGQRMYVYSRNFDLVSPSRSTTLLIRSDWGRYDVDTSLGNTSTLPTVIATPRDPSRPTVVAVHAVSPSLGELAHWRSDLTWLAGRCAGSNVIMAGDFNSTVDHFSHHSSATGADFGECEDAGLATHTGAIGTWPASAPSFLGTPIDHVLATRNWQATGMRVLTGQDNTGSDHRPILVRLSVRQ
jgi:endonuclease/exonuclease/phosphatase (EEP) superfamily protein YafD